MVEAKILTVKETDNRKQKCKNRSSIKEFQHPKEKKDREDEGEEIIQQRIRE